MRKFFVTGTDTEIGKTYSTCMLARTAAAQGVAVACLKPVAAGAEVIDGQLKNEDALALQAAANVSLEYSQVNPYCFVEAIAPHIAAELNQQRVSLDDLSKKLDVQSISADLLLVEGAGGWLVPLNETESFSDIPKALDCEVILVVGMRLGCINHALLTVASILDKGFTLAGWVANHIDPNMDVYRNNVKTLQKEIAAPMLAEIPFNDSDESSELLTVDIRAALSC